MWHIPNALRAIKVNKTRIQAITLFVTSAVTLEILIETTKSNEKCELLKNKELSYNNIDKILPGKPEKLNIYKK